MLSELGINSEDWELTPPAVQTVVLSLQHQLRLFQIRHTGYEQQLAALGEKNGAHCSHLVVMDFSVANTACTAIASLSAVCPLSLEEHPDASRISTSDFPHFQGGAP